MASQKIISGNAYHLYGATIVMGGNKETDSFVTAVPLRGIHGFSGMNRDINVVVDNGNVNKILSGGTLAGMTKGKYVMTHLTDSLAGVSTGVMNNSANRGIKNSIHKAESVRTVRQVTAGWNYVTGAFLTTPTVASDSFGNDEAARPTMAVPGEFSYQMGSGRPVNANYEEKTN